MRLHIIGNPVAGGGKARRRITQLVALLEERGHHVITKVTKAAGDAERWASELPDDIDRLIVVGGDGTLNEVINGLADPAAIPIVQMPVGTANVLVRELGLPWKPRGVVDLIETGKVMLCDMGEIQPIYESLNSQSKESSNTSRRFLLMMSCGFDAMVIEDVQRNRKGKLGLHGYILPIYRTLLAYRAPTLAVAIDGGEPTLGAMAVVSNCRNYAGYLSVADRASMDSGVFDVCILPKGKIRDLMRYGFAAWRAKMSSLPEVTYANATTVSVRTLDESSNPVPIEVDGEHFGKTGVTIRVLPRSLPVVVPA